MSDFPANAFAIPGGMSYSSTSAVGAELMLGGGGGSLIASATWPTASLAIFIPIVVPRPFTFKMMGIVNGTAVSGNIDVGIYDATGVRLVSAGSTVQAGTSALQTFDITDTTVAPGVYYLASAIDNTTGTTFRVTPTTNVVKAAGILQMASGFSSGLVATATYATVANSYVPMMVASGATVI